MSSSVAEMRPEHHLHPAEMLLAALETGRRWFSAAALPGVVALLNGEYGMRVLVFVLLGVALLGALSVVWGVFSWRATTYQVSDGVLRLKQGVIRKSERSLPLARVQGVDSVQGVVQRFFGVVGVQIEAAGGGGEPEIPLSALSRAAAESLREELTETRQASSEALEELSPAVLHRLSAGDLLLAGSTSGQIGVAAPIVYGAWQFVNDLMPRGLAETLAEALLLRALSKVLLAVLAVAFLAWVLAILGTIFAHARFTLSRSADGRYLHIERGLLECHETTVPLARIQAITVVEGVLRQPLGYATLRVESAGFGAEEGVSTALFPLLPRVERWESFCGLRSPSSPSLWTTSNRCLPVRGGATPTGRPWRCSS
jgi:putative membrane protein